MVLRFASVVLVGLLGLVTVHGAAPGATSRMCFPSRSSRPGARKVMAAIGDGVAVLHGAPEMAAEVAFRQNNQFFYLTGVEVPRADPGARRPHEAVDAVPAGPRRERIQRARPGPGRRGRPAHRRSTRCCRATRWPARCHAITQQGRPIYTAFRAEVRGGGSTGEAIAHAVATATDPWDGRPSREAAFIARLRAMAPGAEHSRSRSDPRRDAVREEPARD